MKFNANAMIGKVVNEVQTTNQSIVIHFTDGSCIESMIVNVDYEKYELQTDYMPVEQEAYGTDCRGGCDT